MDNSRFGVSSPSVKRLLAASLLLASASCLCLGQAQGLAAIDPIGSPVSLDSVGLYSIGCKYRDGRTVSYPIGWSADFDESTGVACRPYGQQHGRLGILLHCPWRNGTGVSFQEFRIRMPSKYPATLNGAIALGTYAVGRSDGATFRIFANGQKLLDENRRDDAWMPYLLDLGRFAGQTLTLRFETDPGPKDDPSFDFALWADRSLTFKGMATTATTTIPRPSLKLLAASSSGTRDVVPTDGDVGSGSTTLGQSTAIFKWSGSAGKMVYAWHMPSKPSDPLLGELTLETTWGTGANSTRTVIPFANSATLAWTSAAQPGEIKPLLVGGSPGVERTYLVDGRPAKLRIAARLVAKSLVFDVTCDQPFISEFAPGGWGPVAFRSQVTVPYYSGNIQYLPAQGLFVNSCLDWTLSQASSLEGGRAIYGALTDGSRNRLHERAVFSASWHLAGALPSIPNPRSPYIGDVGGRIVLDTWGGMFEDIAHSINQLHDYGIDDCTAIVHTWQRSGYDNALPAHIPADASLGGEPAMRDLVDAGKRAGYRVALHENYVDYYPNFEGFKDSDIAVDSNGKRVLAWFQPGTKIQSFAVKPTAILRLAGTQSPEIHRRYGTNADYLDVHSAVPPWFHVDSRFGEDGAGTFHKVWETHRDLWAYERETHGGPVFGEGANHWYWSGLLDGTEAQFGVGWPANQGMTAPLMVDFDLLRIHPLQVNHGMGYYERWWSDAGWGAIPPMEVMDRYRMQEVAFGHAGFLAASTWNLLPYAWLEHNLLGPLTKAYAGIAPKSIGYMIDGKWVDADSAAIRGVWDRVRVVYANGLTVVANSSGTDLDLGSMVLPPLGWSATGPGFKASTAKHGNLIADYSETADEVFANARNASFWSVSGVTRIRPEAFGFQQTGPRRFRLGYHWHVGETVDRDYNLFVHFSDSKEDLNYEGIRFQGDHRPNLPTSAWKANSAIEDGPWEVTIPSGIPDGMYAVSTGLWLPGSGRPNIDGPTDKFGRVVLGSLIVKDGGQTIQFAPNPDHGDRRRAIYSRNLNPSGAAVDFGAVRTNGSVHIVRKGNDWILQTFPRNAAFDLELSVAKFGMPKEVRSLGVKAMPYRPVAKNGYWRLPLNTAREYRWTTAHGGVTRKH